VSYDEGNEVPREQRQPMPAGRYGSARPISERGSFSDEPASEPYESAPNPAALRLRRERELRHRRRRRRGLLAALLVFALIFGGAIVAGKMWLDSRRVDAAADYTGNGVSDIIVRVNEGDAGSDIAATLVEKDVIASTGAFVGAAHGRSDLDAIRPGYYKVRTQIPASEAVDMLTNPDNRVGEFVIAEGRQLDDVVAANGDVTDGIYSLIAKASCVELDGERQCVSADEVREAASSADMAELGVPVWAQENVAQVEDPARRLEGLIAAGAWDVDPSMTPTEMLSDLITRSAVKFESAGLLASGDETGLSPYEVLVAASLVERESSPEDFAKVARVILNRLAVGQMLQFDSTVNYALDRIAVGTTDEDRARQTPWNTYAMTGLPLTPISSPSIEALRATENPEPGPWLFFVTIDQKGTTVFTNSYEEHLEQVRVAERNGVFDSGR
jgi:UPF0755 protein